MFTRRALVQELSTTAEIIGANSTAAIVFDDGPAAEEILGSTADLQGKVLIDCTNPLNAEFSGLELGFDTSAAEKIAESNIDPD